MPGDEKLNNQSQVSEPEVSLDDLIGQASQQASDSKMEQEIGADRRQQMSSAQQSTYTSQEDIDFMKKYDYTDSDIKSTMTKNGLNPFALATSRQDTMDKLGYTIGGGLYKGGLTAVENLGYMMDVPDYFSRVGDMGGMFDSVDQGYSNWLSEGAKDLKGSYDSSHKILGPNAHWWQGSQGIIDSAVGFMVPGGVAGKAIGTLGKGFGASQWMVNLATATATNYAESRGISSGVYDQTYNNMLEMGYSDQEATDAATEDQESFMMANKMMILSDFAILNSALGGTRKASDVIFGGGKESFKTGATNFVADGLNEAGEEVFQGVVENEIVGSTKEEFSRNKIEHDKTYVGRALEDWKQHGEAAFWGFAGAGANKGGIKAVDAVVDLKTGQLSKKETSTKEDYDGFVAGDEPSSERPVYKEPKVLPHKVAGKENGTFVIDGHLYKSSQSKDKYLSDHKKKWESENEEDLSKWNDYDESVKRETKEKAEFANKQAEIEKIKAKDAAQSATGTKEQAIKDIAEFIENDAELERDYQEAIKNGDHSKARDLEDKRMSNIFLRYAERGVANNGQGSVDVLIKTLEEAKAGGNEKASQYLAQIGNEKDQSGMIGSYMKAYNQATKVSKDEGQQRKIAREIFTADRRAKDSAGVVSMIDETLQEKRVDLSNEMSKANPEAPVGTQADIMSLKEEKAALENSRSAENATTLDPIIDNRIKEIDSQIKTHEESISDSDSKISEKEIKSSELGKEISELAKQKADALIANKIYSKQYESLKDGSYHKNRKKNTENSFLEGINKSRSIEELNQYEALVDSARSQKLIGRKGKNNLYEKINEKRNGIQEEFKQREEKLKKLDSNLQRHQKALDRVKDQLATKQSRFDENLEKIANPRSFVSKALPKVMRNIKKRSIKKEAKGEQDSLNESISSLEKVLPTVSKKLREVKEERAELISEQYQDPGIKNAVMKAIMGEEDLTADDWDNLAKVSENDEDASAYRDAAREIREAKRLVEELNNKADNSPSGPITNDGQEKIGTVVVKNREGNEIDVELTSEDSEVDDQMSNVERANNVLRMVRHKSTSYGDSDSTYSEAITDWIESQRDVDKVGKEMIYSLNPSIFKNTDFRENLEKTIIAAKADPKKIIPIMVAISKGTANLGLLKKNSSSVKQYRVFVNEIPMNLSLVDEKGFKVVANVNGEGKNIVGSAPKAFNNSSTEHEVNNSIKLKEKAINSLQNKKIVKTKITEVFKGSRTRKTDEKGLRENENSEQKVFNPLDSLGIKPEESNVLIMTQDGLVTTDKDPVDISIYGTGKDGYAYLVTKDPSGKDSVVRLNPGRVGQQRAQSVLDILNHMTGEYSMSDNIDGKDIVVNGIKGLSIANAMDLLVNTSIKPIENYYKFDINRSGKGTVVSYRDLDTNEIISFPLDKYSMMDENITNSLMSNLEKYPLPTNTDLINTNFKFKNNFEWFGTKFSNNHDTNSFLFSQGNIGVNNTWAIEGEPDYGRPWIGGSLIIDGPQFGESSAKSKPSSESIKKTDKDYGSKNKDNSKLKEAENKFKEVYNLVVKQTNKENPGDVVEALSYLARDINALGGDVTEDQANDLLAVSAEASMTALSMATNVKAIMKGDGFNKEVSESTDEMSLFNENPHIIDIIFKEKDVLYVDEETKKDCIKG